ncbi:hypothetical protein T4C_13759 [Trichinella pseudospiralis]|uniref:Uncharacterized protein n=1 Tax=Trichinella pseudospiralis TaxID=6337 RepID=A0A0V1K3B7_TRIPS|nr:hypothetical protein T4C_13759 [Trichinella pseudospiralis]
MPIDSSEKYKLLLQNSSAGNKFLRWDFKVHIRFRSSLTAIRPLEASVDPSVCPIDPKGSIPTTLATPDIHALLYATVAEKLRSARAEGIERVVKICSSTDTFREVSVVMMPGKKHWGSGPSGEQGDKTSEAQRQPTEA